MPVLFFHERYLRFAFAEGAAYGFAQQSEGQRKKLAVARGLVAEEPAGLSR